MSPTSRTRAALAGGQPQWTVTDHLLAGVYDALVAANWQRGNAGAKTPQPRPKPLARPEHQSRRSGSDSERDAARQAALARAAAHREAVAAERTTDN